MERLSEMTKKLFILLTTIVVSCSILADTAVRTIEWTPNTETDMSHYNLYVWSGVDTTLCPFIENGPISPSDGTFLKSISYTATTSSDTWIGIADGKTYYSAVLQAVDQSGNLSPGGWAKNGNSHFILTEDKDAPQEPQDVVIR